MKYLFCFLFFVCFLFGSDIDVSDTDIVERVINFIIFVAIVWYLVADKLKQLFTNRREGIAKKLDEVQEKLKTAKRAKEQALQKLEVAKEKAIDMIAVAKKEAYLIAQKIDEQSKVDIENLIKNNQILMDFEQRKMEREVIQDVLFELFNQKTSFKNSDYLNILSKKVS